MCVSVCRCMCAKIVATLLQNPKFIIYTWKTTILLVRLFTNSMTRGISSSQMQILLTCYSRLILKKTQLEEGHIYIPPSCLQKNLLLFFKYVTLIIFCYFYIYFFWQYDATLWAPYTFLFYLFNQPYKIPLLGITLPALKFYTINVHS